MGRVKAPSAGYRIRNVSVAMGGPWQVLDDQTGRVAWEGKTFRGARNAHYRLAVARVTGKPVSAAQARRAGNA